MNTQRLLKSTYMHPAGEFVFTLLSYGVEATLTNDLGSASLTTTATLAEGEDAGNQAVVDEVVGKLLVLLTEKYMDTLADILTSAIGQRVSELQRLADIIDTSDDMKTWLAQVSS